MNEARRATGRSTWPWGNRVQILRRFIPKGSDIGRLTERELQRIEDWVNNYPRKIHGYRTANEMAEKQPHVIRRCRYLTADRGYDDTELIQWLQDVKQDIKPVIDKRTMRRAEQEKEVPGCPQRYYDEHGGVFCYSEEKGERRSMAAIGYDRERDAQRFRCPAAHYGITCSGLAECRLAKTIRIPLSTDPGIFTQVGRTQYQWKRIYAGRTAVERVNSRLDVSFGFEIRRVRGKPGIKSISRKRSDRS